MDLLDAYTKLCEWLGRRANAISEPIGFSVKEIRSELSTVEHLMLTNVGESIPKEVRLLSNLKKINLHYIDPNHAFTRTKPPTINQIIKKFPSLEEVEFKAFQAESLPHALFEHACLKHLTYAGQLQSLPNDMSVLAGIETLKIEDKTDADRDEIVYKLKKVPASIGKLNQLKEFSLEATGVEEIPIEISQLTQLEKLTLKLTLAQEIPTEIEQLTNLKELTLHAPGVPLKSISKLTQLEKLSILVKGEILGDEAYPEKNQLFMKGIEGLDTLKQLKKLSLDSPYINYIPEWISECSNLEELKLSQVTTLSATGTPQWEHLAKTVLPKNLLKLKKLKRLDIEYTRLEAIPAWISEFAALEAINFSRNVFDEGTTLPKSLGQMACLKEFQLYRTNFALAEKKRLKGLLPDGCAIMVDSWAIKKDK